MSYDPKTIAEKYPTYAQFEGKLDPNKSYLTVRNFNSKNFLEQLDKKRRKYLKPSQGTDADNYLNKYFRDNTRQRIFQDITDNRVPDSKFYEWIQTVCAVTNKNIVIIDQNTFVIEEGDDTKELLSAIFQNAITVTPDDIDSIKNECAIRKEIYGFRSGPSNMLK